MTSDEILPAQRRTVRPSQVAAALQDLGYRGQVVPDGDCVLSAAMGFDFRVMFCEPVEVGTETEYENYIFGMGSYLSVPISMAKVASYCNALNLTHRFAKFFTGQNEEGKPFVAVQMDDFADSSDDQVLRRNFKIFTLAASTFRALITRIEKDSDGTAIEAHDRAVDLIHGSEEEQMKAAELYCSAAEKGFAGSQNNLGDLYERGKVMPQSSVMAAYWYARAAERGEPTAYLSLAGLLFQNADDNWTLVEAAKFAMLAADRLSEGTRKMDAIEILERLKATLPDNAIQHARTWAEDWAPLLQENRLMSDPYVSSRRGDIRLN